MEDKVSVSSIPYFKVSCYVVDGLAYMLITTWKKDINMKQSNKESWKEIDALLKNGVRVTPMRIYMDKHNCDLKTAKAVIDERYIKVNKGVVL
jgi:hypothetical protein